MYAYNLEMFEAITSSGDKCLFVTGNGQSTWIRDEGDRTIPTKLLNVLARAGMPIMDKDPTKAIIESLERRKPLEGPSAIDRPGLVGDVFAWPDGTVSIPGGHPEPVTIYPPSRYMFRQKGSLRSWKRRCAGPLEGQPLLVFAMLLPLMAALRALTDPNDDALFEIVAPVADLAPLHYVIASVTGGHEAGYASQAIQFHEAVSQAADFGSHADHLMVVHDAELYFAARNFNWRANEVRQLLSRDVRLFTHPNTRARSILVIGRASLISHVGEASDIGQLLSPRLIRLHVPAERPHGLFDSLPANCRYPTLWTQQLRAKTAANRGVVYRHFIDRMVEERASSSAELLAYINEQTAYFTARVSHDRHDATAVSVVETFALVYAAGCLAQRWQLLPTSWSPRKLGPLVRLVYQIFYVASKPSLSFKDELQALMQHPDAVHVGRDQPTVCIGARASAELFIDHGRRSVDVVIRSRYLDKFIPNGSKRLHNADVRSLMQRDGRHDCSKKRKITGDDTRLYVFRLPGETLLEVEGLSREQ